jgi:hypothetical protein
MDGAGVDSIVDVDAGTVAVWADENPGMPTSAMTAKSRHRGKQGGDRIDDIS